MLSDHLCGPCNYWESILDTVSSLMGSRGVPDWPDWWMETLWKRKSWKQWCERWLILIVSGSVHVVADMPITSLGQYLCLLHIYPGLTFEPWHLALTGLCKRLDLICGKCVKLRSVHEFHRKARLT